MNGRYSLRALTFALAELLAGRELFLVFVFPFLVLGARWFVAGVFGACGVPAKITWLTSDLVLFFLGAVVIFGLLNGHAVIPGFGSVLAPFRDLALAIQCAGLR